MQAGGRQAPLRPGQRFPDGQLYINLRGFGPSGPALEPGDVVRRFLDVLGVPARRLSPDADALAAVYRSALAGRRILILRDNARDSAQVRPLLPGTPGCLVLVTSRDPLTSLVAAEEAHPVTLGLLAPAEAEDLLARRLGTARISADPTAVEEIINQCARLPLALAIVAAMAAAGRVPLHELAAQLRDPGHRLGLLNGGDPMTDVRAVFAWSYRALTPPAARMFRLLGRHPGPDITGPAMASFAALPPREVRPLLAELTRANLLTEPASGRYTCHDLLRAYAHDLGAPRPPASSTTTCILLAQPTGCCTRTAIPSSSAHPSPARRRNATATATRPSNGSTRNIWCCSPRWTMRPPAGTTGTPASSRVP